MHDQYRWSERREGELVLLCDILYILSIAVGLNIPRSMKALQNYFLQEQTLLLGREIPILVTKWKVKIKIIFAAKKQQPRNYNLLSAPAVFQHLQLTKDCWQQYTIKYLLHRRHIHYSFDFGLFLQQQPRPLHRSSRPFSIKRDWQELNSLPLIYLTS